MPPTWQWNEWDQPLLCVPVENPACQGLFPLAGAAGGSRGLCASDFSPVGFIPPVLGVCSTGLGTGSLLCKQLLERKPCSFDVGCYPRLLLPWGFLPGELSAPRLSANPPVPIPFGDDPLSQEISSCKRLILPL